MRKERARGGDGEAEEGEEDGESDEDDDGGDEEGWPGDRGHLRRESDKCRERDKGFKGKDVYGS